MGKFFTDNKVLILGLLASILAVVQQFLGQPAVNWVIVAFAVGTAVASFLTNNLKGQASTIAGTFGNLIVIIATQYQAGHVSWAQILVQAGIALIAILGGGTVTTSPVSGKLQFNKK